MLHTEPLIPPYEIALLHGALAGVVVSIIIGVYVLADVVQKYRILFLREFSRTPQYKTAYIMVMIYSIVIILQSLALGFLRTNLFSRIDASVYTTTYCQMGYIIFYFFAYSSFSLIHLILIWRIRKVFNDSVYAYPSFVYKTLYGASIMVCFFGSLYTVIQVTTQGLQWIVVYTPSKTFNYCRINNEATSQELAFRLPIVLVCGVINFLINIALLYMFNRGLWLLNKEMMLGMINELDMAPPSEDPDRMTPSDDKIAPPIQLEVQQSSNISDMRRGSTAQNLQVVVDHYKERKTAKQKVDNSVKQVIKMYNIMKKQTILICIAIVSTSIYFIWTGISPLASWLLGWDFSINMICAWLMLSSSSLYWNWCRSKGLCKCCYLNTGH